MPLSPRQCSSVSYVRAFSQSRSCCSYFARSSGGMLLGSGSPDSFPSVSGPAAMLVKTSDNRNAARATRVRMPMKVTRAGNALRHFRVEDHVAHGAAAAGDLRYGEEAMILRIEFFCVARSPF